jgi:hypothetical protein
LLGEPALLASNQEYSRKSVAQDFASSPAGDEPTIATPIDFAHIANSLCEHRVSFCENSDPMLARDGGGIVGIRLGVEKEYSGEASVLGGSPTTVSRTISASDLISTFSLLRSGARLQLSLDT